MGFFMDFFIVVKLFYFSNMHMIKFDVTFNIVVINSQIKDFSISVYG